jgi:predicted RNA-binding Zn-ribbon protein involved in translation (DUF1610 family)
MNDFITLICPSCGGKLKVSQNTLSFKCSHCGTEHILRKEADTLLIESFARCPICNRNDQSQKLSGLNLNNSNPLYVFLRKPQEPINSIFVPKMGVNIFWSVIFFLGGIGFFIPNIFDFFGGYGFFEEPQFIIISVISFGFAALCYFPKKNKVNKLKFAFIERNDYLIQIGIPTWKKAIEKWEKLYYCCRDDCVFIPGENKATAPKNTQGILYREQ